MNTNLIGLLISVFLGPIILSGAKFGLGASLLDGIGGSYSNSAIQEGAVSIGLLAVLAGTVMAPIFGVKFAKKRFVSSLAVLIGVGCCAAPFVLSVVVVGLPA